MPGRLPRADSVPVGCTGLPSDRCIDRQRAIHGHDVSARNRGDDARAIPVEGCTSGVDRPRSGGRIDRASRSAGSQGIGTTSDRLQGPYSGSVVQTHSIT